MTTRAVGTQADVRGHRGRAAGSSQASVAEEHDALLVQIGAELEAARETLGITYAEMARRAGVSRRTLDNLLRALRDPRLSTMAAAARAVGCRLVIAIVSERRI